MHRPGPYVLGRVKGTRILYLKISLLLCTNVGNNGLVHHFSFSCPYFHRGSGPRKRGREVQVNIEAIGCHLQNEVKGKGGEEKEEVEEKETENRKNR